MSGFSLDPKAMLLVANCAIAASAVCGLGLLVVWWCRKRSAPFRHGLLLTCLGLTLCCPLAVGGAALLGWGAAPVRLATMDVPSDDSKGEPGVSVRSHATTHVTNPNAGAVGSVAPLRTEAAGFRRPSSRTDAASERTDDRRPLRTACSVFVMIWAAGIVLSFVRLGRGMFLVSALQRSATPVTDARLLAVARGAWRSMRTRDIPVFESRRAPAPLLSGLFRARIILPTKLETALDDEQLRCVLMHEAAHFLRRDAWMGLLQRTAAMLFWWNPLVHCVNRRIGQLREQICDDHVLAAGGDGRSFAKAIIDVAERCVSSASLPCPTLLFEAGADELAERIDRLTDQERTMTIRLNKRALACAVLFAVTLSTLLFVPTLRAQTPNQRPRAESAAKANPQASSAKETSVRGRVVDQSGQPVGGADVWLPIQFFDNKRVAHTQTDANGQFTLAIPKKWLDPVRWRNLSVVWAYKRGRSIGAASAAKPLFSGNEGDRIKIQLGPAVKTAFRVFDPKGTPLTGATVQPVYFLSRNYHAVPRAVLQRVRATTDQDGRARLPAIPRDRCGFVSVTSKRYGTQHLRLDDRAAAQESTIWLRPVGRLEGRLVADRRKWVRGVRMQIRSIAFEGGNESTVGVANLTTDEEGRFVVPALAEGRVEIEEALDQKLPVRMKSPNRGEVEVVASKTKRLEIPLVSGVPVRGQIRVKGTGEPVVGARISIRYGVMRQGDHVVSDKNGRFEGRVLPGKNLYQHAIALPAGLVQLGTQDPAGDDGKRPPPRAPWDDRFEVPAGAEVFDMPVIDVAWRIRVSGRLLDENDRPIVNASLWGEAGNRRYGFDRTDDQGRFTLRLPPGVEMESYRLSLNGESYTATVEEEQPLVLRVKLEPKAP